MRSQILLDQPRRHPVAAALVGGLIMIHLAWAAGAAVCPRMTMSECLLAATSLVIGASLTAIAARVLWLGIAAARAIATLPRVAAPAHLKTTARQLGLRRLQYVRGTDATAFCTGVLRPRVYITTGALTSLAPTEVGAVLAHEAAHARRRDPLRRLLACATADVCFYLPLARWWSRQQNEKTELSADRSAIAHAGRPALAGALLTAAGPNTALTTGFDGATNARIAQLLGDDPPARRPTPAHMIFSALGLLAAIWLAMCLGQAALTQLGLL
jgi:Zn-dependent protease with chaperone function